LPLHLHQNRRNNSCTDGELLREIADKAGLEESKDSPGPAL